VRFCNDGIVFVNFFCHLPPFSKVISKLVQKTDPFCIKIIKTFFLATHQKNWLYTRLDIRDGSSPVGLFFFIIHIRIIKGVRVRPPFHYPPVLFRGGCYFLLLFFLRFRSTLRMTVPAQWWSGRGDWNMVGWDQRFL